VAGIGLSLRFAHGFGLLHERMKASNALFDADRRIQIADFSPMRLETGDAELLSGEWWSPAADVCACAPLLFEIAVGRPDARPTDRRAIVRRSVNAVDFCIWKSLAALLGSEALQEIQTFHWLFRRFCLLGQRLLTIRSLSHFKKLSSKRPYHSMVPTAFFMLANEMIAPLKLVQMWRHIPLAALQ
jgi:hypothetical protein